MGAGGCFDWSGVGGGLDALFEEPGLQIAGELVGLLFDAVEGGEWLRWVLGEEASEDRVGVLVELAANLVAIWLWGGGHG